MRGSLVHDALYQLMRRGLLNYKEDREPADRILYQICREDGMSRIRAKMVYLGVHWFGKGCAKPMVDIEEEIYLAPQ